MEPNRHDANALKTTYLFVKKAIFKTIYAALSKKTPQDETIKSSLKYDYFKHDSSMNKKTIFARPIF